MPTVMVTVYIRYILDLTKLTEFERYGQLWIPLGEKFGGQHHGYFLPGEGAKTSRWRCSRSAAWPCTSATASKQPKTRPVRRPCGLPKTRAASSATSAVSFDRYLPERVE